MPLRMTVLLLATMLLLATAYRSVQNPYLPMPFPKPAHFPEPVYDFNKYPLTKVKIALGRRLFYDPFLSRDGSVSCASCHQQASAFTQHGHRLSHGINDSLTEHNSMPLMNLAWQDKFGWDGGIHALDLFPVSPLQHPHEMGENLVNLLGKLRQNESYRLQFLDAFANDNVSSDQLLQALSQFMLTMVSATSRYDQFVGQQQQTLTQDEQKGLTVFEQKCHSCHGGFLFTDLSLRNNGLRAFNRADIGLEKITQKTSDRYKFKVPSLRNVAVTAPYMHDGRFGTLEEVLDHYSDGVVKSATLDPLLTARGKLGIRLSAAEKQHLIQFLGTLTDKQFLTNPAFSEPETDAMYRQRIDFPVATIRPEVPVQLQPLMQRLAQLQTAAQDADVLRISDLATQLKIDLEQVDVSMMNEAQRQFYKEQSVSMRLDADHLIRIKEILHQKQHLATLFEKGKLISFAFKLNK
ncbi:cytochrome c peroxidase (plasmid) [Fibrisoma limi BUZ 3]|uniref:Cytochrome c peroxidase n=1 Tax=Fibrisoma limi BUZ 3 TaxID=1185876 RepID=I2GTU8_9BACT|nr:cytochrome c peroxidase [Fibrisoma limi]CCH57549.1 cytochrome c peroxidase [Fibrisoma limi BUZ 3]